MRWIFDVLVGWAVGSALFGMVFELVGALLFGAGPAFSTAGVLIGTVVGIGSMRWRRAAREGRPWGQGPPKQWL